MSTLRGTTRQYWVAIRSMIILTVVLGILYPVAITVVGLAAPAQAHGSPLTADGKVVGSALIGQSFTDKKGNALAEWFQSRPSAAGDGYDGGASSGSNQGTESDSLIKAIKDRRAAIAKSDGVDPARYPLTRSRRRHPASTRISARPMRASRSHASRLLGICPRRRWPSWSSRSWWVGVLATSETRPSMCCD